MSKKKSNKSSPYSKSEQPSDLEKDSKDLEKPELEAPEEAKKSSDADFVEATEPETSNDSTSDTGICFSRRW